MIAQPLTAVLAQTDAESTREAIEPILTILPPLAAIALALITRQVLLSLFCGIWLGYWILHGGNPISALLGSVDSYVVNALADVGHAHIILFCLSLGGMIGVIHYTGGIRGLVLLVSRLAKNSRSGQVTTGLLGTLVFFDDYANTLIVGNTMRPFTDRVRISREKLSFLVDATAAPVATIGVISTWAAYQIGLVAKELPGLGPNPPQPYLFFLNSIPYAFYSILMLVFVFMVASSLRDFGPMRRAEERCRATGAVLREGATPLVDSRAFEETQATEVEGSAANQSTQWFNAVIPIACLLGFTAYSLFYTGMESLREKGIMSPSLREIIGEADAYKSLLWAGFGSSFVAIALGFLQRRGLATLIMKWVEGARSLVMAAMILLLAWSLGSISKDLGTGDAVVAWTPKALSPGFIPALTFGVAGIVAFATGTSYGTMAILIPIVMPLSYDLSAHAQLEAAHVDTLGFATLSAILGGSVFGDHCSPISDTTVLSSMACGADHVDHVRTQLPYALLVASAAMVSYLLVGYGIHLALVYLIALTIVVVAFLLLTRRQKGLAKDS